jgi:hypothetical protein
MVFSQIKLQLIIEPSLSIPSIIFLSFALLKLSIKKKSNSLPLLRGVRDPLPYGRGKGIDSYHRGSGASEASKKKKGKYPVKK